MTATANKNSTIRVLVVDDNEDILVSTELLLHNAGFRTRTTDCAGKVLNVAMEYRPDLILLDRILPDGDGIDVCRQIKTTPELGSPLVILLSGLKTAGNDQADGLDAGADGYIRRPVGNRELLSRVESILRVSKRTWHLRQRAERQSENAPEMDPPTDIHAARKLIHELQVHQAEVEIQNEELRVSQAQLEASRNQYAVLFETSPVGYALLDKNGIIQRANTTFSRLLDVSVGRIHDDPFTRWIKDSDRSMFLSRFRAFWKQPEEKVIELSLIKNGGERVPVELRGNIIPVGPGQVEPLLLVSVSDTSLRMKALQQLRESEQEAIYANRAKDEFLAVMSHELRTPLNPIIGFSSLMLNNATDEQRDMLTSMLDSGKRMLSLVERILDFTQLDKAGLMVNSGPFNFLECCETALNEVSMRKSELQFEFQNGSGALSSISKSLEVISDRGMVMCILENLLSNAAKYTKEGFIRLTVGTQSSTAINGKFQLIVEDSGIGIDPNLQGKVFEAFSQADSSFSRSHQGIGLGLAITRKLVEILNGSIDLESTIGKGSKFTVSLPLNLNQATTKKAKPRNTRPATPQQLSAPLEILVVDDENDNNFLSRVLLKRIGANPSMATSGKEALQLAGKKAFDAILMDIRMPVMNGFETTKAIRKQCPLNASTPILALSANLVSDIRDEIEKAGMDGYITKPIHMDNLFVKLEPIASGK